MIAYFFFLIFFIIIACIHFVKAESLKIKTRENIIKFEKCYECHSEIKDFHEKGKHSKISCLNCHESLEQHLKEPESLPETKLDHKTCGKCHKDQYESFISINLESKPKVEKANVTSRSPLFDILMRPHGFTREHAEPRSHIFALIDHLLVDRAYGGRFQLKDWKKISDSKAIEKSAWDVLKDLDPQTKEQKIFPPFTSRTAATAANPVCLSCKTQDHILKWAYMGDKNSKAKWDRTSYVVEMARQMNHPINCFICHDPHSAEPRVVRDALINAVIDRKEGTYPYDYEKSNKITLKKLSLEILGLLEF